MPLDEAPSTFATAASAPPLRPKTQRSLGCIIGLVVLALFGAGVIGIAVAAYQALRLGPEARDLRDAVQEHFETAGSWHPVIEIKLGPMLCALGRQIVIHAADDPDATMVLKAARAIECGVYKVDAPAGAANFLRDATAVMDRRGWTRVVAVADKSTTVAVFVPEHLDTTTGEIEIGAVVYDDQMVVVAVVRTRIAPLLELMQRHAGRHMDERLER